MKKLITFFIIATLVFVVGCSNGSDVTEDTNTQTTTEEAVTEEPTVEEPVTEEPTAEEPATEEPAAEEPVTEEPAAEEAVPVEAELSLTLEELATYDGSNGNPAYIAIEGVIYDVTNSKAWNEGKHNGYVAGKDLTVEMRDVSPHGFSKLDGISIVGKIKE